MKVGGREFLGSISPSIPFLLTIYLLKERFIMGDAKRRGTFEERKVDAIVRQKAEAEHRMAIRAKIAVAKTPEQKLKENRDSIRFMTLLEMASAFQAFHLSPTLDRYFIHNFKPKWRK